MMAKNTQIKDTLVAIMNNKKDFKIAIENNWYRIPTSTKITPTIVRENKVNYITFYQTSIFNEKAFQIEFYAKVKNISIVKRKELFPDEIKHENTEKEYFKIEFENLIPLPNIIKSKRHRRMLFVTTSIQRLLNSREFNDIFLESPIEEKLYHEFKKENIDSERQYILQESKHFYYLDFALFCKERNLDIECDGDKYHLSEKAVKRDKKRNNTLSKLGWIVLRYSSDQINSNIGKVINEVKDTINRYGGVESKYQLGGFDYFKDDSDQFILFD